jgi:hypothetical protein
VSFGIVTNHADSSSDPSISGNSFSTPGTTQTGGSGGGGGPSPAGSDYAGTPGADGDAQDIRIY